MSINIYLSLLRKPAIISLAAAVLVLANCSGGSSGSSSSGSGSAPVDQPPPGQAQPIEYDTAPQKQASVIAIENAKPGTTAWKLVNPSLNHEVEGYASLTSVNRGGTIDLFVRTSAASYNVDIYRMGYYGGSGARLMQSFAGIARQPQPVPCMNPNNVIECNWSVSLNLTIPAAEKNPDSLDYWASGVYLAKLSTNTSPVKDSYIIFVVRDDARSADYVSQLPVTTYQAYNFWGGKSLYTGCEVQENGWECRNRARPATAVSFNRPYGRGANVASASGVGAGEFLTNVQSPRPEYPISNASWDYNMVRWMEKQGYDIKYITNLDLHEDPAALGKAKAFVSTGHDEYYSKTMWDRLVDAKNAGVNLAFFSANQVYWQVRFVEGAFGTSRANRIMICYRGGGDPETDNNLTTDQFRYLGRPEAALIGNQYIADPVVGDVTLTNTAHWLFANTGARDGMVLKGLLGYEINAYVPGVSPAQTKILARSVAGAYASDMTYYVDQSSAQVFSTGTMQWAWGLDDFAPDGIRENYADPVAQAFTANLFDAMGEKHLSRLTLIDTQLELMASSSTNQSAATLGAAPGAAKTNLWWLRPTGDGEYGYIVARVTGLCLQPIGGNAGAQVATGECTGADNQRWRVKTLSSGAISLVEKSGGLCLTASSVKDGGAISVDACSHSPNQSWVRSKGH